MLRKIASLFVFWLFCLAWALHLPFSESEIWGLFLSEKMIASEGFFHPAFIYKASFHGLLGLWGVPFTFSDSFYLGSRVLFSFLFPAAAALLFWTKDKDQWAESLAVLVISAPFLFLYGSVVRADLLASILSIFLLWSLLQNYRYSLWMLSLGNVFLLLSTPKSVFFMVALIVAAIVLRLGKLYLKSLILPGLCLAALIFIRSLDSEIISAYSSAWSFFVESYDESLGRPAYWSVDSFIYLIKFIFSSPLWFVLWVLGLWKAFKDRDHKSKSVAAFSTICLLFLLFHNDKLPFFIVALSLSGFFAVRLGWQSLSGRRRWYLVGVAALWSIVIYMNAWQNYRNGEQLKALRAAEEILRQLAEVRVFDGTGLFAKFRGEVPYFLGPSQPEQKKNMLETLLDFNPQFIFYTSKLFYGEPEISEYMRAHEYAHLGGGVYTRGLKISILDEAPGGLWVLHAGQEYYVIPYEKWVTVLREKMNIPESLLLASPKDGQVYIYPPMTDEVTMVWERQLLFKDAKGTFRSYGDYLSSSRSVFTQISEVYIPRANTLEMILATTAPWKGSQRPFAELFAFPRDLIPWKQN